MPIGERRFAAVVAVVVAVVLGVGAVGCAAADTAQSVTTSSSGTVAGLDVAPNTSPLSTSAAGPTSTTSTSTTTSTTPTTTTSTTPTTTATAATTTTATDSRPIPPVPTISPYPVESIPDDQETVIGQSVQGRDITLIRRGTPGGSRVLLIGAIHGNEDAGVAIIDHLRTAVVPEGVELWLVPSMNPDGQAMRIRHNANGVDLNRNFPHKWDWLAEPGNWQYGGSGPASEPEVQAMVSLAAINPDLTLWYHQDLFRISPSTGRDGAIRQRYADLTALPVIEVSGGTYTGTASQWSRTIAAPDGIGFTVELGDTLPDDDAIRHANAVLTVATEL